MHRQSAYLFGRDRLVADIPVDHPSCSKQHSVFQYRLVEYERKNGTTGRIVKPYIIDLGSTNGTFVNNKQIEAQRYFELREKDVIKFGFSSREYVLLHEESKNDLEEDDEYEELETSQNKEETQNKTKQDDDLVKVKIEKKSPSKSPKTSSQKSSKKEYYSSKYDDNDSNDSSDSESGHYNRHQQQQHKSKKHKSSKYK
jgi:pSer/pThr/pTyr-binding forkhead associated (FHA) protein